MDEGDDGQRRLLASVCGVLEMSSSTFADDAGPGLDDVQCYTQLDLDDAVAEALSSQDTFMREVAAALLGPPEEGHEWGGGGILDGIRDLKARVASLEALIRSMAYWCPNHPGIKEVLK